MIEINSDIQNAIEIPKSISMNSRVFVQPSLVFMDTFDDDTHAPSFADNLGISNDPIPQEIAYISSGSLLSSFFTHEDSIKYMLEGDSDVITISSISCVGKIGIYGDSLFYVDSSFQLKKHTITWSSILSKNTSPLDAGSTIDTLPESLGYAISAVSETECVVFYYDDGGMRAVYYNGTTAYEQPNRFMFPVYASHERINRSIQGMVTHSTGVKLNSDVFAYISNPLSGHVEGIKFNGDTKTWSDIYIAVPTDLDVTQYETRIANSYVRDGKIYISCQLHQIELVEDETVISFIISSDNGRNFAYNRYTSVSNLGYRFLACINNNTIMISSCNRITSGSATYVFSPISGSDLYTDEITAKLVGVTGGSQQNASMSFSDSDYSITDHPWVKEGNRILWQIGYNTSSGFQYVTYGTFIIDNKSTRSTPKGRICDLRLVNESLFNLSSLSSPYYTEVISKSSLYDDFSAMGNFNSSGSGGLSEDGFALDFWRCDGSDAFGATSATINTKSGLDAFEFENAHKVGIKTQDIKQGLNSSAYPLITSTSVHVKFYGWSFDDRPSGSSNDIVSIAMICSGSDGEYTSGSAGGVHFPCTYPDSAAGDYPIEVNLTGIVGDRIKRLIVIFECGNSTMFYVSRIEVTSGVRVTYSLLTNSAWEYVEDDNEYKLPARRKAFVMTANRPYNAYNFIVSAGFRHDLVGYLSAYTVATGLSGLGSDNGNYICGRYNLSNNKFEIIKVRESLETVLVQGDPTTTVTTPYEIQFEHRDGHFIVRLKISDIWVDQLSYDWQESDSYMVMDHINANDVGIYGKADTPFFRVISYISDVSVDSDNCIALAVLPGYNTYSGFPASGKVKLDDTVYTYTTKMAITDIRGPYQFRQCGDGTKGQYVPPFGIGEPGLEYRDHDWTRSNTADVGRLCAIDDGVVFSIIESKWDVWITTDGAVVELPGRARHYGNKTASLRHALTNRVYVTYGLTGLGVSEGEDNWHYLGTEAQYHYIGDIYCTYFNGSSGNEDATVKDIINSISNASGARAEFEDITFDEISISGSSLIGTQEYISGFDLYFALDKSELGNGDWISVLAEAGFTEGNPNTILKFTRDITNSRFVIELYDNIDTLIEKVYFSVVDEAYVFRVLYHDNFVTVYINNTWAYTFGKMEAFYSTECSIYFNSNTSITAKNIVLSELGDWSEAFYIDLDTNGRTAVSQIIRERPVEIISRSSGNIKYSYNETRELINLIDDFIRNFSETSSMPDNCASNAIIYADIVRTLQYHPYLERFGFATRIFRMPNLTITSLKAANLTLKRNMESADKYKTEYRPDPRIEVGDKIGINVSVFGSGKTLVKQFIVENLSINLKDGDYKMSLDGRKSL